MPLLLLAIVAVLWLLSKGTGATGSSAQAGQTTHNGLDNIGQAIANFEGFNVPGSVAQRSNNPGNVGTYNGNVASYTDVGDGWTALNNWITSHGSAHPDWTLQQFINDYLTGDPTGQTVGPGQDPQGYASYVGNYLGVPTSTPVGTILAG